MISICWNIINLLGFPWTTATSFSTDSFIWMMHSKNQVNYFIYSSLCLMVTHASNLYPKQHPSLRRQWLHMIFIMMTSSNGNIFRVTGHLRGEFTGHRWIPRKKASDVELWCFLPSCPLCRHSNDGISEVIWPHVQTNSKGSIKVPHCWSFVMGIHRSPVDYAKKRTNKFFRVTISSCTRQKCR